MVFKVAVGNQVYVAFGEDRIANAGRHRTVEAEAEALAKNNVVERGNLRFFIVVARPRRELKANGLLVLRRCKVVIMYQPRGVIHASPRDVGITLVAGAIRSLLVVVERSQVAPRVRLGRCAAAGNGDLVVGVGFNGKRAGAELFHVVRIAIVRNLSVAVHLQGVLSGVHLAAIVYPLHDAVAQEVGIRFVLKAAVFDNVVESEGREVKRAD